MFDVTATVSRICRSIGRQFKRSVDTLIVAVTSWYLEVNRVEITRLIRSLNDIFIITLVVL